MVNSAPYLIFLACAAIHSIATAGAEALIPFYTKSLGASTALAGLPFVVNSVSRLFTDPVAGAISDRLGNLLDERKLDGVMALINNMETLDDASKLSSSLC